MPDQPTGKESGHNYNVGFVVGWTVFLALFVIVVMFGWRVWYYYDKLRRGEIVHLPQYKSRLTVDQSTPLTLTNVYADRQLIEREARPSLGTDEGAKLTIVEFADFDCSFSKDAAAAVRTVMGRHGSKVRFVFRHYPLTNLHPDAEMAAEAAECAYEQGKFWPYHDKLFANQSSRRLEDFLRFGREVGMNETQLQNCLTDGRYRKVVADDAADAVAAKVVGTPTFFFNGEQVAGSIPEDVFEGIVSRLAP